MYVIGDIFWEREELTDWLGFINLTMCVGGVNEVELHTTSEKRGVGGLRTVV